MKPRPHAEMIKAWADGCEIQYRPHSNARWVDSPEPAWVSDYQYRIKPVEPERVYPPCVMSEGEIIAAWTPPYGWKGLRDFGDKVLKHAIDKGQIVTREEFDRAITDRNDRDLRVAKAVAQFLTPSLSMFKLLVPDDEQLKGIISDIR